MKIAFFTDVYHPVISGLVENLDTSAVALRKLGHEVFIVAPKTPGYKGDDPNVFWIPSIKYNQEPELRLIIPLPSRSMTRLLSTNLDVIHGHAGGPTCFLGMQIARQKKIPYIYTHHTRMQLYTHYVFNGKLISPNTTKISLRFLSNLSSRVIAPTRAIKKELTSWGVKSPIEVIAGGLDLHKFKVQEKGFLRDKYKIDDEKVVLLYVGRVGLEKSIDFLIKAFAQINEKTENAVLFIVGDGPERENLQKLSEELGLQEKVIFTGFISMDKVAKVYADGDIFVFSSRTETQGLVLYEAMSQGLPVVAVKDNPFEDVVVEGKTGFQTKPTLKDFSQNVLKLVEDKKLRGTLGRNGQDLILNEFSIEQQAKKLEKVYEEAIAEKAKDLNTVLVKESFQKLVIFLKMNQALNRFRQVVKLPKWYN